MPRLLTILWAFTRGTDWLPVARKRYEDAALMLRLIRRGWITQTQDAFIARDGPRIHALYVRPCARGQGHGRRLLNEAKANTEQLELWVLERNHAARAFYTREGFAEVLCSHGLGNDENMRDILMVWQCREQGR